MIIIIMQWFDQPQEKSDKKQTIWYWLVEFTHLDMRILEIRALNIDKCFME